MQALVLELRGCKTQIISFDFRTLQMLICCCWRREDTPKGAQNRMLSSVHLDTRVGRENQNRLRENVQEN